MSRSLFHSQRCRAFVQSLLSPFESAALLSAQGDLLGVKAENISDLGTLGTAGQTARQYLNPQPGDLVLLNDPFSGGNLLSNMTLIYGMEGPLQGNILVVRTGFRAKINLGDHLEEEGLRIPPTPLAQAGVWAAPLLMALCSHPQAPKGLESRLRSIHQLMRRLSLRMQPPADLSKTIKEEAKQDFLHLLSEIPHGETQAEHLFETGEALKLQIKIDDQGVRFDFSGTSPSKKLGLTDSATFGASLGAFLAFHGAPELMTSVVQEMTSVQSPLGSWVNSKYPTPTFRGMTEGAHKIADLVWTALERLGSRKTGAASPLTPTWVHLEFVSGERFFDSVPTGLGGHAEAPGELGLHLWLRSPVINSIEQIESVCPLQVLKVQRRSGSGGSGHHPGGDGLVKQYKVLSDCTLHWIQSTSTAKGSSGGQAGEPSVILAPQKQQLSASSGSIQLKKNSIFEVRTAGGGGFGKAGAADSGRA